MTAYQPALLWSLGLLTACGDNHNTSATDSTATPTGTVSSTQDIPTEPTTGGAETTSDASSSSGSSDSSSGEPLDPWQAFLAGREDTLRTLAEPLVACIADIDMDYPVFSGCYDWAHAVQASYALHVVSRLTGDPSYIAAAEAKFTADALTAEIMEIEGDELVNKVLPFAHAWFLALAIERERAGKMDLRPLADAAVARMLFWYDQYYDQDLTRYDVLKGDESNIAWMWLSMWQWAQWTDDAELTTSMRDLAQTWLLEGLFGQDCPWSKEEENLYDPLAPCLFGTHTILTMFPGEASSWLDDWLPALPGLQPVVDGVSSAPTLNFSRARSLWKIQEINESEKVRTMFLDHFNTALESKDEWLVWEAPAAGIHTIALTYPD